MRSSVLVAAALCGVPGTVLSQSVEHYRGAPSGCDCTVGLEVVAEIRGDFVGAWNVVAALDLDTRLLYTTNASWRDRIFAYRLPGPGAPVAATVSEPVIQSGRSGDGPGEYRNIVGLALAGDTLVAIDDRLQRGSLLSLDGEFISSFRLPGKAKLRGIASGGGSLIGHFGIALDASGPVLHELRLPGGETIRRFGERDARRGLADAISIGGGQHVIVTDNGDIVTAWPANYSISTYSPLGDLLSEWRRELDSFPHTDREANYASAMRQNREGRRHVATPLQPHVVGLWEVRSRGWIAVALAVPQRASGPGPGAFRSIFEFWDIETGEVVTALRDTRYFFLVLDGGYALELLETEAGEPSMRVWRLVVEE